MSTPNVGPSSTHCVLRRWKLKLREVTCSRPHSQLEAGLELELQSDQQPEIPILAAFLQCQATSLRDEYGLGSPGPWVLDPNLSRALPPAPR